MDWVNRVKELVSRSETDAEWKKELQADPRAAMARELGMSVKEFEQQLSDFELESVAGGYRHDPNTTYMCGKCGRSFGNSLAAWLDHMLDPCYGPPR